jgi:hypothetical protein
LIVITDPPSVRSIDGRPSARPAEASVGPAVSPVNHPQRNAGHAGFVSHVYWFLDESRG